MYIAMFTCRYAYVMPIRDEMLPSIKHCKFPDSDSSHLVGVSLSALRPLRTRTTCSVVVVCVVYMYIY